MDRKKLTRLLAAALALALLSGCSGNTGYNSESSAAQTADAGQNGASSEQALFSTIDTEDHGEGSADAASPGQKTSEQSGEAPIAPTEEDTAPATSSPETSDTEISAGSSQTADPADPVQTEQTVQPSQPDQTTQPVQPPQTEQTTQSSQPAQTTQPNLPEEPEKPDPPVEPVEPVEPVDVVIPDVKIPLSPGVDIASNEKAVLDYSNASEGYISVCRKSSDKAMKLRIIFGEKTYDHDIGKGEEYFPLSCGSGTYKVQIYENTEGNSYAKVLEQDISAKMKRDTSPFLYPNKYVSFDSGSNAVRKSAELCAGKTDVIEKLAAIFQWITANVTYDKELAEKVQKGYVTEYIPDPDSVLKKKTGICYDYASLFAAMTRSQDIPTRLVKGYASPDIYHAWNEVYTEETGWITPELLLSKHGYNILDSTFYAGSSDKEKIAEYISDSGNYSALYYY